MILTLSWFLIPVLCGCSSSETRKVSEDEMAGLEQFTRTAFAALVGQDLQALLALCAQPGDIDRDGQPLIREHELSDGGERWRRIRGETLRRNLEELARAGDLSTMRWIGMGRPIGCMLAESGFVGNMFILVELGGCERAIEVGSSQLTRDRGRVIVDHTAFALKTMEYYREMAAIF